MDKVAEAPRPPMERAPRPVFPDNLSSLDSIQLNKLREACWAHFNNFFQILPNPKVPEGSLKKKMSADLDSYFPGDSSKPLRETAMKGEPGLDIFSEKRLSTSDKDFFKDVDETMEKLEKEGKISLDEIANLNKEAARDARTYILLNKKAQPVWDDLLKQGYSEHDLAA